MSWSRLVHCVAATVLFLSSGVLSAPQDGTTPPAAPAAPTTQDTRQDPPSEPREPQPPPAEVALPRDETEQAPIQEITAIVTEVVGAVHRAPAGTSPLSNDGWTPVITGEALPQGTLIRTGLRSHVTLAFGETTYLSMRTATFASIDALYRTATSEVVRIGLGYGTIRGGAREGELRSDVIVDAPPATLAKIGTDGFEISAEAGTGRFRVALARSGLVLATRKRGDGRGRTREVRPGEYANERNIANKWINQAVFDRNVTFYDPAGVTAADAEFSTSNTRGFAVVGPGIGGDAMGYADRNNPAWVLERIEENFGPQTQPRPGASPGSSIILLEPTRRPEGNFGTPDESRRGGAFRIRIGRARAR
jgi:hypothetical protein